MGRRCPEVHAAALGGGGGGGGRKLYLLEGEELVCELLCLAVSARCKVKALKLRDEALLPAAAPVDRGLLGYPTNS